MLRSGCCQAFRRFAAVPVLNGPWLHNLCLSSLEATTSWEPRGSQSLFQYVVSKTFTSSGIPKEAGTGGGRTRLGRSQAVHSDFIQETLDYHDPSSTAGQTTWNLIWNGEENGEEGEEGMEVWECDFTGGAIPNNEINALLSNRAKWEMYNLHKDNPEEYARYAFLAATP